MPENVAELVETLLGSEELPRDTLRQVWQQLGFQEPQSADGLLAAVAEDPFARGPLRKLLPVLIAEARPLADLDRMFRNLVRFAQAHGSPRYVLTLLAENPPLRDLATRLWTFSESLSDVLVRNPEYLEWLVSDAELERRHQPEQLRGDLTRALAPFRDDLARALEAVRRFQRRALLRIGVRDLLGLDDLDGIVREISHLADAVIGTVLDLHQSRLQEECGSPRGGESAEGEPVGFCVLGMGKLGGEELNYSSDIDLIFVYGQEGYVWRDEAGQRLRGITNHEYFSQLGKRLVTSLTAWGREGFLYRVDLRLRPEGDTGALTRSLDSCEVYYASQGETWERMALIKARPVAGDAATGEALLDSLSPFIHPRHLVRDALEEIAAIKARAERQIVRTGELKSNLKLGRGGIREIEFVVQALQLLHAGRRPELRGRRTLDTLERLREAGLMDAATAGDLARAYCLLRTVEHRIQMDHHRQTHTLPGNPRARSRLAASLGMRDADQLAAEIGETMRRVRRVYDSVLAAEAPAIEDSPPGQRIDRLIDALVGERAGEAQRLLSGLGWPGGQIEAAVAALRRLGRGPEFGHSAPRTRRLARRILGALLQAAGQMARPCHVHCQIDRFVTAYGARSLLLESLASNPRALNLLWHIFDASDLLGQELIRSPEIFDDIVAGRALAASTDGAIPQADPLGAHAGGEGWSRLSHLGRMERFRLALRFLEGLASETQLLRGLSDLADQTLRLALRLAAQESPLRADDGLGLIALGGWGGREVGLRGDLDLAVVGAGDDAAGQIRLACALAGGIGAMAASAGRLAELHLRFWPQRAAAPSVIDQESLRHCRRDSVVASGRLLWTRARSLGGLTNGAWVEDGVAPFSLPGPLSERGWCAELVLEIARDRERRVGDGRGDPAAAALSFQHGPGGLSDLETVAQAAALRRACQGGYGPPRSAAVPDMLATAVQDGWFAGGQEDLQFLVEHYSSLRGIEQFLRLRDGNNHETLPSAPELQRSLALRLGHRSFDALAAWHRERCDRCRRLCDGALARVAQRDFGTLLPGTAS